MDSTSAKSAGTLLEAQQRVLESIVRGRPLSAVLGSLCQIVEGQAGTKVHAVILLSDELGKRMFVGAAPSLPAAYCRALDGTVIAKDSITGAAAAACCEAVVTRDIASDPRWRQMRHLPLGIGLKAAWSMPILSSSGAALGAFTTYFQEVREPTPAERQLVEVLAQTASLAIERARADAALQTGALRDRFLAELAAATQPLTSPVELMETTARLLAQHLGADRCAYAEVESEDTFVITGNYGPAVPSIVGRWPIAAFGPACMLDMLEGRAYVVTDTDSHPSIGSEHLPAYRATNIRAVICVPLHKQGRLTAAMAVHQTEPRVWLQEELELVSVVVARSWEALERARVSRTLQESEARYRAMVEASPDCVTLIAADGTLLQINRAGLAMMEVNDERAVLGTSIYELIAPAHRSAFELLHNSVCRGEHGTLQLELSGKRGGRRWMELSAAPVSLTKGEPRAHLAIARDMTARVEAENALAQSRARLDYAVKLSGVGFWYCDLPFDELIWDDRVKSHFFLPSDARVTIDDFYALLHAEDRDTTRTAIERSIETHEPYDVVYRTQCPVTHDIKWIRALGGTIYDEAQQPVRFDGVTLDVTALRRAQERLAELLEGEQEKGRERANLLSQLREQERRKDEFLATLGHELRNPLAALRFGLELLDRNNGPEVSARAHATMERQLTHLVRMVDDLLEASRITLGKLALQTERLDFRLALQSALETARPLIESNGQVLDVQMTSDALPLDGDPTRLSQVLANLLNNAAKYTPSGGRIEVRISRVGQQLEATVRDNGTGIPPDMLERVFDMFTQIERSVKHARGGLGLGLTLVRKLVELHGGTVVAASAGLGQGSSFTLRLPLADAVLDATEPVSPTPTQNETAQRSLRVLVVDDNEDAAECLASLLDLSGHHTHLAHSGPDAVTSARAFTPDVILLDIGLPGFDGYEVARRLHEELGDRVPRLVACTGFGSDSDKRRSQEAGFDAHLVKPISTALLMKELAAAASVKQ